MSVPNFLACTSNVPTDRSGRLVQLLGEVEGLKAAQESRAGGTHETSMSIDSLDNLRTVPEGYEPEGQAGTGSTQRTGSGYFTNTNPPSRQPSAMRGGIDGSRNAENRISTVHEGDEEPSTRYDDPFRGAVLDQNARPATPTESPPHHRRQSSRAAGDDNFLTPKEEAALRQFSVPVLLSPPTERASFQTGPHSNENTPRTERSRTKHKSTSSSIIPRISRWSETTASTVARAVRGSGGRSNTTNRKQAEYYEPASRSGSDLAWDGDFPHDPQGADGLLISGGYSREATPTAAQSPLAPPGATSAVQEDAKYQAHRNSINLEHPQPRPGPSYRYQNKLESQADQYGYTRSDVSSERGEESIRNVNRFSGSAGNRYSGGVGGKMSPISDGGYSQEEEVSKHDTQGPPRPPKIPTEGLEEGGLVPPPKSRARESFGKGHASSPLGGTFPTSAPAGGPIDAHRTLSGRTSPMRSTSGHFPTGLPARKPMGARPISSAGSTGGVSGGGRDRKRGSSSNLFSFNPLLVDPV